jgi:opacity protein-like surface antigen
MVRVNFIALAGAAALVSTATLAADLPPPLLPPPPVPVVVTGGWYLRGDVGLGIQRFSDFQHHQLNQNFVWPRSWQIVQHDMGDTDFIGFGIGYAWNNWFRFDVTGERRKTADLKVVGQYFGAADFCPAGGFGPDQFCFDHFNAHHSAWVVMANAYLDLGTWWCLTPFIGAGIGAARHQFDAFTDSGFPFGFASLGFVPDSANSNSKWTRAWALHAGVAYNVTNNVKIELAYRYINFGDIDTPNVACFAFGCGNINGNPNAFYTLTKFDAQELRIGVRFMLTPDVAPAPLYAPPPPVMRKG